MFSCVGVCVSVFVCRCVHIFLSVLTCKNQHNPQLPDSKDRGE